MVRHDWTRALPEDERTVYESAGFGSNVELGRRCALLIVDVTYGFAGHRGVPFRTALRDYPYACPDAWTAIDRIARLLEQARQRDIPVIFTHDTSALDTAESIWHRKQSRLAGRQADDATIVEELAPLRGRDVVIDKRAPSAFFNTSLMSLLSARQITDLIITGTSTSGCVRASVVDAFSHGLSVFVVPDCTFDRARTSHNVSLYEMSQKYATVMALDELLEAEPLADSAVQ